MQASTSECLNLESRFLELIDPTELPSRMRQSHGRDYAMLPTTTTTTRDQLARRDSTPPPIFQFNGIDIMKGPLSRELASRSYISGVLQSLSGFAL